MQLVVLFAQLVFSFPLMQQIFLLFGFLEIVGIVLSLGRRVCHETYGQLKSRCAGRNRKQTESPSPVNPDRDETGVSNSAPVHVEQGGASEQTESLGPAKPCEQRGNLGAPQNAKILRAVNAWRKTQKLRTFSFFRFWRKTENRRPITQEEALKLRFTMRKPTGCPFLLLSIQFAQHVDDEKFYKNFPSAITELYKSTTFVVRLNDRNALLSEILINLDTILLPENITICTSLRKALVQSKASVKAFIRKTKQISWSKKENGKPINMRMLEVDGQWYLYLATKNMPFIFSMADVKDLVAKIEGNKDSTQIAESLRRLCKYHTDERYKIMEVALFTVAKNWVGFEKLMQQFPNVLITCELCNDGNHLEPTFLDGHDGSPVLKVIMAHRDYERLDPPPLYQACKEVNVQCVEVQSRTFTAENYLAELERLFPLLILEIGFMLEGLVIDSTKFGESRSSRTNKFKGPFYKSMRCSREFLRRCAQNFPSDVKKSEQIITSKMVEGLVAYFLSLPENVVLYQGLTPAGRLHMAQHLRTFGAYLVKNQVTISQISPEYSDDDVTRIIEGVYMPVRSGIGYWLAVMIKEEGTLANFLPEHVVGGMEGFINNITIKEPSSFHNDTTTPTPASTLSQEVPLIKEFPDEMFRALCTKLLKMMNSGAKNKKLVMVLLRALPGSGKTTFGRKAVDKFNERAGQLGIDIQFAYVDQEMFGRDTTAMKAKIKEYQLAGCVVICGRKHTTGTDMYIYKTFLDKGSRIMQLTLGSGDAKSDLLTALIGIVHRDNVDSKATPGFSFKAEGKSCEKIYSCLKEMHVMQHLSQAEYGPSLHFSLVKMIRRWWDKYDTEAPFEEIVDRMAKDGLLNEEGQMTRKMLNQFYSDDWVVASLLGAMLTNVDNFGTYGTKEDGDKGNPPVPMPKQEESTQVTPIATYWKVSSEGAKKILALMESMNLTLPKGAIMNTSFHITMSYHPRDWDSLKPYLEEFRSRLGEEVELEIEGVNVRGLYGILVVSIPEKCKHIFRNPAIAGAHITLFHGGQPVKAGMVQYTDSDKLTDFPKTTLTCTFVEIVKMSDREGTVELTVPPVRLSVQ